MRLFFVTVTIALLSAPAMAQDVSSAASSLQDVLSSLKQSADQLDADNSQLASRDQQIQSQLAQLQDQLQKLQAQGGVLNNQVALLQQDNSSRGDQVSRLVEENRELDRRIQQAQQGITGIGQFLGQKPVVVAPLPVAPKPAEDSQAAFEEQKARLQLIKQIYDSQQRQESLHQQIRNFQKNTPMPSAADALAHQQLLEKQIQELEAQESSFTPTDSASSDQGDNSPLNQLQDELTVLEKNYTQLKGLIGQIDQRSKGAKIPMEERSEDRKLQDKLDGLTRQGEGLKADLDGLRSQLVDLDKRKTSLEAMVKQVPSY